MSFPEDPACRPGCTEVRDHGEYGCLPDRSWGPGIGYDRMPAVTLAPKLSPGSSCICGAPLHSQACKGNTHLGRARLTTAMDFSPPPTPEADEPVGESMSNTPREAVTYPQLPKPEPLSRAQATGLAYDFRDAVEQVIREQDGPPGRIRPSMTDGEERYVRALEAIVNGLMRRD